MNSPAAPSSVSLSGPARLRAAVIGASAGGVEALLQLLPTLPASFPLPVMIVVHIPSDRPSALPELFASKCQLKVKEAEDKEPIQPATVYFAPPDYHLLVETEGCLSLSSDEPALFSRPSIDLLFESAADAYGPDLLAVILTGASSDGSRGLRAACEAGATAWVQEPASALAPLMPNAALEACPAARVLSLSAMRDLLAQIQSARP